MRTAVQPHVAIVQHSLRRYRAPFLEALRTRLADAGVGLRLIHSDAPDNLFLSPARADLPWATVRPGRRFSVGNQDLVWQPVLRDTRHARLVILEQATHLLANYVLLARQAGGGPPVAFWGHGRNFLLPADARVLSERVKQFLSLRAHWWFAYNDLSAQVVAATGYPGERITAVENATDTRRLARQVDAVDDDAVAAVRRDLGLASTNVGLFVGTFGAAKRLDYLFAAADLIRREVPDFELVLAGKGTEEPAVAAWVGRRPWVSYAGRRFEDELAPLLATAKLLLVPAWAGLVVVDSFAAGVPLVASSGFPHPPEIDYLRDGQNGRLVADGGDPARYAMVVAELLTDEPARARLVHGCRQEREHFSVERMADRFTDGILRALAEPRRARGTRRGTAGIGYRGGLPRRVSAGTEAGSSA